MAEGIYDLPCEFKTFQPVILDIGANVGAYCKWASNRWPGCRIHAYEPHPENFAMLENGINEDGLSGVIPENVAVRRSAGHAFLFEGKNNCGECSLEYGTSQVETGVTVEVIDAATLPTAHIIKIDSEGAEIPILERLAEMGRINAPIAYSLEFHSARDRRKIDSLLAAYTLISGKVYVPSRGVVNYMRSDLLGVHAC